MLKYYGTIASLGGVGATGRAAYLLWGVGATTDSISVYTSGDYTQGTSSLIGFPKNGKVGAVTAAGVTIFNNFYRK